MDRKKPPQLTRETAQKLVERYFKLPEYIESDYQKNGEVFHIWKTCAGGFYIEVDNELRNKRGTICLTIYVPLGSEAPARGDGRPLRMYFDPVTLEENGSAEEEAMFETLFDEFHYFILEYGVDWVKDMAQEYFDGLTVKT